MGNNDSTMDGAWELRLQPFMLALGGPGPEHMPLQSVLHLSIESAAKGLRNGPFTSQDLVKTYLARIHEAKEFNTVLEINPNVLEDAKILDEERARAPPLHGIPILVKDNIVTKDPLEATAGSWVLLGYKPAEESSMVAKLRAAGVLILGKTSMSEWANFRGTGIANGWSPAAICPSALTSRTLLLMAAALAQPLRLRWGCVAAPGSIIDPAQQCNVVGLKPSRGLISGDGMIPISKRQDVMGTLTRTVKDAAYLLNYMAGKTETDQRTWKLPFDTIPDFTASCNSTDLSGISIGVPRKAFPDNAPEPLMSSFNNALDLLRSAGARVVEDANFTAVEEFNALDQSTKNMLRSSDFKIDLASYLGTLHPQPNHLKSLEHIIQCTEADDCEDFPHRDMDNFIWTQKEAIDPSSERYKTVLDRELYFGREGGILGALEKHNLDVLVTPAAISVADDLAARVGFPVMSVPMGFWPEGTAVQKAREGVIMVAPGIPYCMTIVTKAFSDTVLLNVAHAFEQLSAVRKNGPLPYKLPTTEINDVQEGMAKS